jgi:hypothetical protein
MSEPAGAVLREKFRAESAAMKARIEASLTGGKHSIERGMRREQVVVDFLRGWLPPRYGVARGEITDSTGQASRQCDVVVYDALHAPLFQRSEASYLFPAECVYAVIEVKPHLTTFELEQGLRNIGAAKALDRSAIVAHHHGHRIHHGPAVNPPLFGAVVAATGARFRKTLAPALARLHRQRPVSQWLDCVCVLDDALFYHFEMDPHGEELHDWVPAMLSADSFQGYYESGADTLLLFSLFLLWQLNARELFPPDLLRYADGLGTPGLSVLVDIPLLP